MKKIVLFLLLLVSTVSAVDIEGRDNVNTLADMITGFYDKLFGGSISAGYQSVDTATVMSLLNSSALNTSVDLYCVQRDTTLTIAAETSWYDLPTDFYCLPPGHPDFGVTAMSADDGLEIGMKLISIDQIGANRLVTSGSEIPSKYLIRKNKIYIEPVNNDSDSVKIYYAAYANSLDTTTDTTNLDNAYVQYAILGAVEEYLKAVNWGSAQSFAVERLKVIQAAKAKEEAKFNITRKSVIENLIK